MNNHEMGGGPGEPNNDNKDEKFYEDIENFNLDGMFGIENENKDDNEENRTPPEEN